MLIKLFVLIKNVTRYKCNNKTIKLNNYSKK